MYPPGLHVIHFFSPMAIREFEVQLSIPPKGLRGAAWRYNTCIATALSRERAHITLTIVMSRTVYVTLMFQLAPPGLLGVVPASARTWNGMWPAVTAVLHARGQSANTVIEVR